MGKLFYTLILISLVILAFGKYFFNILLLVFVPEMKIIKGKIIALKARSFSVPASSISQDVVGGLFQYQEPSVQTEYFVFIDENNKGKHFIKINVEAFNKLKREETSLYQKITSFYFSEYYLFGSFFDHFEIETT